MALPASCTIAGCRKPRGATGKAVPVTVCKGTAAGAYLQELWEEKKTFDEEGYQAVKARVAQLSSCGMKFHQECAGRCGRLSFVTNIFGKARGTGGKTGHPQRYYVLDPRHLLCGGCATTAFNSTDNLYTGLTGEQEVGATYPCPSLARTCLQSV